MKTISIILSILLLSSCYTYKSFDPEEYAAELAKNSNQSVNIHEANRSRNDVNEVRRQRLNARENKISSDSKENEGLADSKSKQQENKEANQMIDPSTIKISDVIQPNQFYKVDSQGKEYTIEAKQWKSDTLYAVVKRTEKELKFHKNDISSFKIRKFSKGKSDALTVASYALGGAAVLFLLK
ncbi:hypothetical protein [Empedobacter brevis]|uniref:hypothetical protein n=1 Tax=Empedobacter brevis TaxID=247 RepID=UPI0039B017E6